MQKWLLWLMTLVLAATLAACGKQPAKTITLTDQENGKNITLKTGQILTIRLEANPTTGYAWELGEVDSAILQQAGNAFTPAPQGTERVGAGGIEEWRFQAVGVGTTTLVLNYRRPWEQESSPAKTFTLTVIVEQ